MSASIPPNSTQPKATVTHEFGDVRITVRGDLTPLEAFALHDAIRVAARAAEDWRDEQLETIEEAGK
jgi:hypothetical protein